MTTPRRAKSWCVAPLVPLALTLATSAAASPSARLVYLRGAGADACPDEQALRAAVGARLGYDPFFPWAANTLFAEIVRTGGAWHADVKLVDSDNRLRGSRDLRIATGDCAAAIDAMALSISLAIDPTSLMRPAAAPTPPAPASAPEPEPPVVAAAPPPPPAPAPVAQPEPTPPPSEPSVLHIDAGLGVLAAVSAAPAPDVGAVLFASVRLAWLSATLEARGDLISGAVEDHGTFVRSSLLAASIVPCAHVGAFFGCAVATTGELRATSAVASPREEDAPYLAFGGRGGAAVPLGGAWSVRLHVELLATATRPTLQVDGTEVFTYAPFSADAGAALVLRFR